MIGRAKPKTKYVAIVKPSGDGAHIRAYKEHIGMEVLVMVRKKKEETYAEEIERRSKGKPEISDAQHKKNSAAVAKKMSDY